MRGDSDFTVDDFDSMPYLLAMGKVCLEMICLLRKTDRYSAQEILRVHPAVIEITRAPKKDDVLPLSKPVIGVSGKVYNELPVPAGTITLISITGYNLCVDPFDLGSDGTTGVEADVSLSQE